MKKDRLHNAASIACRRHEIHHNNYELLTIKNTVVAQEWF